MNMQSDPFQRGKSYFFPVFLSCYFHLPSTPNPFPLLSLPSLKHCTIGIAMEQHIMMEMKSSISNNKQGSLITLSWKFWYLSFSSLIETF